MTEIQTAMLALYRACKNQYNSKDSCRGCLLCDIEAAEQACHDEFSPWCEAGHPIVWDVFHTWLKTGDSAGNSVKKCGDNDDGCSKKMSEVR